MGLSNSTYYQLTMEHYRKASNRLIRCVNVLTTEAEKYEKEQLEIMSHMELFADVISNIQNRPQFSEISIDKIKIPQIKMEDLSLESQASKKLKKKYSAPEIGTEGLLVTKVIKTSGIFGKELPGMDGSVFGVQAEMAIDRFMGSSVLSVLGKKKEKQIDELNVEIKKITKKVDKIVPMLEDIKRATNSMYNSMILVAQVYQSEFEIVKSAVSRTDNYNDFSTEERIALKNSIMLIGLLFQMCKVQLLEKRNVRADKVVINQEAVVLSEETIEVVDLVDENYRNEGIEQTSTQLLLTSSTDDEELAGSHISSEMADAINVKKNYVVVDTGVVYYDSDKDAFMIIDNNTLDIRKLNIELDFRWMFRYNYVCCGQGDKLYFVYTKDGYKKLYEYSMKGGKCKCIYSAESLSDDEATFIQCNKDYIVYAYHKGRYMDGGYNVVVYYIEENKTETLEIERLDGFYLFEESIFLNISSVLYKYSIIEKEKEKICKLEYGIFDFLNDGYCSTINAKVEGSNILLWGKGIECDIVVLIVDLDNKKRKKISVKEDCTIDGLYHQGYVYYIKSNKTGSLCRCSIKNKKKECIVKQTDCSDSCVRGVAKRETSFSVSMDDVSMQIIDNNLYYLIPDLTLYRKGYIMKVELDNDFLLSDITQ